jgi:hypothetical protein
MVMTKQEFGRLSEFGDPTKPIDVVAREVVRVNDELEAHKEKIDVISKVWLLLRVYIMNMNHKRTDIFQQPFETVSQSLFDQLVKVRALLSTVLRPEEFREMQGYFQKSSVLVLKEGFVKAKEHYHELNIED